MMSEDRRKTVEIDYQAPPQEIHQQPTSPPASSGQVTHTRRYISPSVRKRYTDLQAMTPELLEQYQRRQDEKRRCKCNHLLSLHSGKGKCTVCKNCKGYHERDEDDFQTADVAPPTEEEVIEELRNKK